MACLPHAAAAPLLPLGQVEFHLAYWLSDSLDVEAAARLTLLGEVAIRLPTGWQAC